MCTKLRRNRVYLVDVRTCELHFVSFAPFVFLGSINCVDFFAFCRITSAVSFSLLHRGCAQESQRKKLTSLKAIESRSSYVTLPWQRNFWMTTNRKTSFKTVSDFIDLGYFQLICQMLAKFSGVKPERTVFKLRKSKKKKNNNNKIVLVHLVYRANV